MKVIDCFIFYNELEMLSYRLCTLSQVVDTFILVEATHTHSGVPKPLFFADNKDKFAAFANKIVHVVVDDFAHLAPTIDFTKDEQWVNELHKRDCIKKGLNQLDLQGDDVLVISDLDEIPDRDTLYKIKNRIISVTCHKLAMDFYYYNLNSRIRDTWGAAKVLTVGLYRSMNLSCSQIRLYECPLLPRGGWHLSYFGDAGFIKNKIESFAHQELNTDMIKNNIETQMKSTKDVYSRPYIQMDRIPISANKYLPHDYETYLNRFILYR